MVAIVAGALIIGLTLGLLGSGGSVLTVPTLVYLVGHGDKVAIAESLAVVGAISVFGAIPYAFSREIDWRSVVLFGLPGTIGAYGGAWLSQFVPGAVQLILFAVVMIVAAYLMFRARPLSAKALSNRSDTERETNGHPHRHRSNVQIAIEGVVVGVITGLVGVGGGFLIVPALALLGGLPMRLAVGTSLVVIAMKSFAGFYKYLGVLDHLGQSVDWSAIVLFVILGSMGTFLGNLIGTRLDQRTLRRGFSMFLVAMAAFVLVREIPHLFRAVSTSEIQATRRYEPASAPLVAASASMPPRTNLESSAAESVLAQGVDR